MGANAGPPRRRYAPRPRFERGMGKVERVKLCRLLRRNGTTAEALFWEMVRDRRLLGRKFRRQHPLGKFVVDFYCAEATLAIELDGQVHAHNREHDRDRDEFLAARGVRVLRIPNDDLLAEPEDIIEQVADALLRPGLQ